MEGLILAQFIEAGLDKFGTRKQLKARGVDGYCFTQHGGMLSDVIIVSPIVAYILSKHWFDLFGWRSILIGAIDIVVVLKLLSVYRVWSVKTPEAHAHNGKITIAGWIHTVYAVIGIWTVAMFYFAPATPAVPLADMLVVTLLFMPWCVLGTVKFSPLWSLKNSDIMTMVGTAVAFWLVFFIRAPFVW
jgi:hypothetical protein